MKTSELLLIGGGLAAALFFVSTKRTSAADNSSSPAPSVSTPTPQTYLSPTALMQRAAAANQPVQQYAQNLPANTQLSSAAANIVNYASQNDALVKAAAQASSSGAGRQVLTLGQPSSQTVVGNQYTSYGTVTNSGSSGVPVGSITTVSGSWAPGTILTRASGEQIRF